MSSSAAPSRPTRALLAAAAASSLILVATACGGGAPTPSPTSPAPAPTPTPTRPPAPGSSPTPSPSVGTGPIVDLARGAPLMTIWAADSGDLASDRPNMAAGDFNGDGVQDILIGARFGDGPDNARQDSGEVYVVFGSAEPPPAIDVAAGEQDLTVFGADPGDNLGLGVAAGDINGDGIDDLLLGAPFGKETHGGSREVGTAYVVFGSPDLGGSIDLAEDEAGVTLIGAAGSSFLGDHLASGDVNGDGTADLLVGATFAPGPSGGGQVGAVYVVFGSAGLSGTLEMGRGQFDAAMFGAEDLDEVGDAVASADVNGDGIDDIITVGEAADGPNNQRPVAAEVYVFFGSPQLGGTLNIGYPGDQDLTVFGAEENDTLGFSLAAGDVNGDGIGDIVMVARLASGPGNATPKCGELHFVFGSPELGGVVDAAADETDASLYGADRSDLLSAVELADTDGDGVMEIVAGTGFGDGPDNERPDGGEVYVIDGQDLGKRLRIDSASVEKIVYGAAEGDRTGASVIAGDINGDGSNELTVMSVAGDGPDGNREDAGQIYVVSVRP